MEPHAVPNDVTHPPLADDILTGADAIAEFLFGSKSDQHKKSGRRKVYYLAECTRLPVFRLGAIICARRSVLLDWISGQEAECTLLGEDDV